MGSKMKNKIDIEKLKNIIKSVVSTTSDEISCSDCQKEVDKFVELNLEDKEIPEAYSLIEAHLNQCSSCREEYEVLLTALKEINK